MNWIPELTGSQSANLNQADERSGDPEPERIESGSAEVEVDPGLSHQQLRRTPICKPV